MTKFFRRHLGSPLSLTCNEKCTGKVGNRYHGSGENAALDVGSLGRCIGRSGEGVSLMYPRRTGSPRRRSGTRRATRHLWLIALGACVPLLIVAYALVTETGDNASDAAYVSGTVAHGDHGQASGPDGWGRGGYTMMPGPAGSRGVAVRGLQARPGHVGGIDRAPVVRRGEGVSDDQNRDAGHGRDQQQAPPGGPLRSGRITASAGGSAREHQAEFLSSLTRWRFDEKSDIRRVTR
jgi:hypothetical protein